ncbi:MAG: MbtH family NRPS accessory protein [Dermatophilaceae bacterium]
MSSESTAVVVNHLGQYSVWPSRREAPLGWSRVGFEGPLADCLGYIERVWTDGGPQSIVQSEPPAGPAGLAA